MTGDDDRWRDAPPEPSPAADSKPNDGWRDAAPERAPAPPVSLDGERLARGGKPSPLMRARANAIAFANFAAQLRQEEQEFIGQRRLERAEKRTAEREKRRAALAAKRIEERWKLAKKGFKRTNRWGLKRILRPRNG